MVFIRDLSGSKFTLTLVCKLQGVQAQASSGVRGTHPYSVSLSAWEREEHQNQRKVQPLPRCPWLRTGPRLQVPSLLGDPKVWGHPQAYSLQGTAGVLHRREDREKWAQCLLILPALSRLEPAECQQEVPVSLCGWDGVGGGGVGKVELEVSCELLFPQHPPTPVQAARALSILAGSQSKVR